MKIITEIGWNVFASLKKVASKDEARYTLYGFNLRSLNGFIVATATDGIGLVSIRLGLWTGDDFNVVLPPFVPSRSKVLTCVEIDTDVKQVLYKQSSHNEIYKLIDGQFPNFTHVTDIALTGNGKLTFNISKISTLIDAAKIYAPNENLFISPNDTNASLAAISRCPEWFGMLMPVSTEVSIPTWLKK